MDIEAARNRADEKMRAIARMLKRRAERVGHAKAIEVCDRLLAGDDSAGDDIQQGMRTWGL